MHPDWYQTAIDFNHSDQQKYHASPRSQAWARGLPTTEAERLHSILKSCRSIARSFGLPRDCPIHWATELSRAAGLAGFRDAPQSFDQPFIQLDHKLTDGALADNDLLDVYCGVVLHEASHIRFSREIYRTGRQAAPVDQLFRGLWEDEFVEQQVRRQRPGFACYLHASKQLLIRDPSQEILWEQLPDLDRINLIYFLFIRTPDLIAPEWQSFTLLFDSLPFFDQLRNATSACPVTEADFQQAFHSTHDIWKRARASYPYQVNDFLAARQVLIDNGGVVPDLDRLRRQFLANLIDDVLLAGGGQVRETSKRMSDASSQLSWSMAHVPVEEQEWFSRTSDEIFELAFQIFESEDVRFGRRTRRYGLPELIDLDQNMNTISQPISDEIARQIDALDTSDQEDDDVSGIRRKSPASTANHPDDLPAIWIQPDKDEPAKEAFEQASRAVRGHSQSVSAAIPKIRQPAVKQSRGQRSGRLDRRALHRHGFDERIFSQRSSAKLRRRRIALGLLLDESGSMQSPASLCRRLGITLPESLAKHVGKDTSALQVAALFQQAIGKREDLELEIYSHTTDDADRCQLKYLFGSRQTDPEVLGCYLPA